ncbi:MAG TPA: hypothetical protein VE978_13280 [Chitinophagales bacterium]|nr:hypothetical protein [Chitinophagales bacterium]
MRRKPNEQASDIDFTNSNAAKRSEQEYDIASRTRMSEANEQECDFVFANSNETKWNEQEFDFCLRKFD